MRSDLMNLPPQTLTQLVWAVLYRSGWTEFTAVGDGAFLMAEDGDGARRVGVVYTPGTDANEMADLIGGWLAAIEVKSVTRRELFCLTRRPTRPERFFPATAADAPLVIHTRSDVDRLFVEGELGEQDLDAEAEVGERVDEGGPGVTFGAEPGLGEGGVSHPAL